MPVAGPQTIDAVQEIKSQGSKCIVVGVDTDQENSTTVNDHSNFIDRGFTVDSVFEHEGNNGIIKFSATKDISYMTEIISYLAAMGFESTLNHGDTEEPKIGSYGYLTVGDLENNGVGVSDAAGPFLMKFIKSLRPTATASDVQDIIIKYILATAALSELPQVIDPITGESEN
jgi:basic membrane lipoprotein Med (substrate-binding protein (PBP1-ABC) superfamily)